MEHNCQPLTSESAQTLYARLDLARQARQGFAEVVYGEGKTPEQIREIAQALLAADQPVLVTRVSPAVAAAVRADFSALEYHEAARCLTASHPATAAQRALGTVAILSAGTADLPVAEEAALVAQFLGLTVHRFYDVGVAGLHRLLSCVEEINQAEVIICVAGMEGALLSVMAGLTDRPVIGVPSGVGYGIGSGGEATLYAMLNCCASGVGVVNIGNGFGAAYLAATICRGYRRAEQKACQPLADQKGDG